ncbi:MAG: hypothetical protein K8I02_03265, partial [Candidatus Methylomirabilis sp.]|nr:hypothetical protein [Deltaproteobacteria bacterium]
PVLASAVGAMAERIVDGENGFLTPPGDSAALAARLLDLARRPDSLAGVIEGLRAHRPKTLDENAADYARLYEELLGPSDGGARLVRALLGVAERMAA